jgi:hypothetical protein
MERVAIDADGVTIRLSEPELRMIKNALNEIANGVDISDSEFQTRLGESRSIVRQLLTEVGDAYSSLS